MVQNVDPRREIRAQIARMPGQLCGMTSNCGQLAGIGWTSAAITRLAIETGRNSTMRLLTSSSPRNRTAIAIQKTEV